MFNLHFVSDETNRVACLSDWCDITELLVQRVTFSSRFGFEGGIICMFFVVLSLFVHALRIAWFSMEVQTGSARLLWRTWNL